MIKVTLIQTRLNSELTRPDGSNHSFQTIILFKQKLMIPFRLLTVKRFRQIMSGGNVC